MSASADYKIIQDFSEKVPHTYSLALTYFIYCNRWHELTWNIKILPWNMNFVKFETSQLVSQSEFFGFLFLKCGIYFHFIKLWKSAMICSRVVPIVWQPWWALMEKSPQLLFGIVVMHSFRPTEISVGLLPFAKALSKWHWIENICELGQKLQCF